MLSQSNVVTCETKKASVLRYTDLLKEYGKPSAPKVQEYRKQFENDETFQKRANAIDALFLEVREPAPANPG
jgi:hypothetical protein